MYGTYRVVASMYGSISVRFTVYCRKNPQKLRRKTGQCPNYSWFTKSLFNTCFSGFFINQIMYERSTYFESKKKGLSCTQNIVSRPKIDCSNKAWRQWMMSETGKLYRTEVRKKGKKNREKGLFFATILQIIVGII